MRFINSRIPSKWRLDARRVGRRLSCKEELEERQKPASDPGKQEQGMWGTARQYDYTRRVLEQDQGGKLIGTKS